MMSKSKLPVEIVKGARVPQGIAALAIIVMALAACRRLIAQHSFVFYCWYYFNIRLALHQEKWAHKLLRSRRCLVLSARKHGKSEVMAKLLPLWLIARDRNVRILIVTAAGGAKGLSSKHVRLIKAELTGNKRLIQDFGLFYDPKLCGIWQQEILEVIRDRKMKDATLEAVGIFGTITGGRFDFIIIDDLIDLKKVNTPEQIAKVEAEVTGTILPLLTTAGCAWMSGTRKNFADIYGWALKNLRWQCIVQKAIIREPAGYDIVKRETPILRENINGDLMEEWHQIVFHSRDHGKCLWPEGMSMVALLLERLELGSIVFNREYQNEIVDDATTSFRLAWLLQCRDESLSYVAGHLSDEERDKYEIVIHATDPALVTDKKQAKRTDSDYMVQVVIGLTKQGERVLLVLDRERGLSPDQVETRIITCHNRIRPWRLAIEANSFGIIHAHNLINKTGMPVMKHYTGSNKNDPYEGVPHLSPLFENAKFRLP